MNVMNLSNKLAIISSFSSIHKDSVGQKQKYNLWRNMLNVFSIEVTFDLIQLNITLLKTCRCCLKHRGTVYVISRIQVKWTRTSQTSQRKKNTIKSEQFLGCYSFCQSEQPGFNTISHMFGYNNPFLPLEESLLGSPHIKMEKNPILTIRLPIFFSLSLSSDWQSNNFSSIVSKL